MNVVGAPHSAFSSTASFRALRVLKQQKTVRATAANAPPAAAVGLNIGDATSIDSGAEEAMEGNSDTNGLGEGKALGSMDGIEVAIRGLLAVRSARNSPAA